MAIDTLIFTCEGAASIDATACGFRLGESSTHTSRTIMLKELRLVLEAVPDKATRENYRRAVLIDNCLGKRTAATRKLSLQRLSELYALDPKVPLFRAMRDLWFGRDKSQPIFALLMALARDPLLRLTAGSVLQMAIGDEFARKRMADALAHTVGTRFSETTLEKVVRNAASSWTQSGHLQGRTRKIRQQVRPTPEACAFALLLGYLTGKRGRLLLETLWAAVLDISSEELVDFAREAKHLDFLEIKLSGSVLDISFPHLTTTKTRVSTHGANRAAC